MADAEDLKLVMSGEVDLSDCDLSEADLRGLNLERRKFDRSNLKNAQASAARLANADLSKASIMGLDLSQADLRGARFGGAMSRVNFSGSDLRGAHLSGLLSRVNFSGADVRGTNFSGVVLRDNCTFDGAVYDEGTNFEGASTSRSVARLPIFRDYELIEGRLKRRRERIGEDDYVIPSLEATGISVVSDPDPALKGPSMPAPGGSTLSQPAIAAQLSEGLSERITLELEQLNQAIPNEPAALDAHNRYVDLLTYIRAQIDDVSSLLAGVDGQQPDVARARSILDQIGATIGDWAEDNGQRAVRYGVDVTMLGVGIAFLASCGVASVFSFPVLAAILCGKEVAELIPKKG